MTNRAVLRRGRVLVGKRPLFIAMTPVANLVDGWFFQVSLRLAVTIVAIRANHLAFLDGMMRRHRVLCINLGMALVADVRLLDRHRQPLRP